MNLSILRARLGKKAERKITVPLPPLFHEGDEGDGAEEPPCIVVPLSAAEDSEVLAFAAEYARSNKAEPKEGDPLYDLGIMAKTIALAVRDIDSPPEARTPFFDGGTDQIFELLPRETIVYLFELCQIWQDACSPSVRRLSVEQLVGHITELAEAEDDGPFVRLSPATRSICMRILARLQVLSLGDKSLPTSLTERVGSVWSPRS
ncbi:hypothetical protein LZC95_19890 [Pendulispora brunnea]|uniref:Uncharacterized protein n=1 Tax=Pendulispora brunnea TaxID=2905690 RepID=A0ABZ2KKL2_9BACT